MVYDDRHRPASLAGDPSWRRWSAGGARRLDGTRARGPSCPIAASPGWPELRYRHLVPSPEEWDAIRKGRAPPGSASGEH